MDVSCIGMVAYLSIIYLTCIRRLWELLDRHPLHMKKKNINSKWYNHVKNDRIKYMVRLLFMWCTSPKAWIHAFDKVPFVNSILNLNVLGQIILQNLQKQGQSNQWNSQVSSVRGWIFVCCFWSLDWTMVRKQALKDLSASADFYRLSLLIWLWSLIVVSVLSRSC
jgi:hypothetical protein